MKRVVIISDTHCGHRAGLTPPGWWYPQDSGNRERDSNAIQQRQIWAWFKDTVEKLGKVHALFVNGDVVDGKGERSGGTEQLEPDRIKQCDMAVEIINMFHADEIVMTHGTPYHTGKDEDFESIVAGRVGATIHGHVWPVINGLTFDLKHKVGGSTIPHGRYTALARDQLWNELWAVRDGQPMADILIRSHVHYCAWIGSPGKLGLTTPALQGWGSKYGTRQCSGLIDVGFVSFDIGSQEVYSWKRHLCRPKFAKEMTLQLFDSTSENLSLPPSA